jgi:hypothetical protein
VLRNKNIQYIEERERLNGRMCMCVTHPCPVLNAVDVELHGDVEAVEKVPSKHQGVHWSVDSVDPT